MQMYILVYKCVTHVCVVVFGVPVFPGPQVEAHLNQSQKGEEIFALPLEFSIAL